MAHPVDLYVGQRLRLRRTMLGMSQEDLGEEVGVTFQQVQKYERGLNRIGSSRLHEFSRILNTSISYFFDGYIDKNDPSSNAQHALCEEETGFEYEKLSNKEVLSLVRAYYDIKNPTVRKRVLALVRSLATMDQEEEIAETT